MIRSALGELFGASSVQEAQVAAADLIDAALESGAAVSKDAPVIVAEISTMSPQADYFAYGVAVFTAVAPWIGAWSSVARADDPRDRWTEHLHAEVQCSRLLNDFASRKIEQALPNDAEARSHLYRLWGMVLGDSREAVAVLVRAIESDDNVRAAECAIEGLATILARDSDVTPHDPRVRWLGALIASGPTTFTTRVALAATNWFGQDAVTNRDRILELFGSLPDVTASDRSWPSELIA